MTFHLPGEVVVSEARLAELEHVERAHSVYLAATRRMRVESAGRPCRGLRRFAELIAEEDRRHRLGSEGGTDDAR